MLARVLIAPAQRGLEVVVLRLEAIEPGDLLGTAAPALRLLGQGQEPGLVPAAQPHDLAGRARPLVAVLPDRLQQPIPGDRSPGVGGLDEDHGLVHELRQEVERLSGVELGSGADALDRLEREPACEHRQAAEQRLLRLREQVVAPVERRAQRLLARLRRPAASRQEAEPIVEPLRDLVDAERARTRAAASSMASGMPSSRRQISATAAAFCGRQGERRRDQPGALDEEPDRLGLRQAIGGSLVASSGTASDGTGTCSRRGC